MSFKIKWKITPELHENWHACLEHIENVIQCWDFQNMNSIIIYWVAKHFLELHHV